MPVYELNLRLRMEGEKSYKEARELADGIVSHLGSTLARRYPIKDDGVQEVTHQQLEAEALGDIPF